MDCAQSLAFQMLNKIRSKFIAQKRQGRLSPNFSELGMPCILSARRILAYSLLSKNSEYVRLLFALVLRGNKPPCLERCLVVVGSFHRAHGDLHLLTQHLFVRDQTEQVTDAVEARAPLVVGENDVPGCKLRVRGVEHYVARARVVEPPAPRA